MAMHDLRDKALLVLDMDGTVCLGETLIPGVLDFIGKAGNAGKKILFFTNNSSRSMDDYARKLRFLGIQTDPSNLLGSSDVTIWYLKKYFPGKKVYLVGTQELYADFEKKGIRLVDDSPDAVVLGFDTQLTYEKIRKGCTFIREGAAFLATHPDVNCPVKGGLMPDCGSMIQMFSVSSGKKPLIMGKPTRYTVEAIEAKTGISREQTVYIGDRLETDIAMGMDHEVMTVLVLTGVTTRDMLAVSHIYPTLVVDSVRDLESLL